jgi:hypothetical protein
VCVGTAGVAEELIRMALPIMRADFKVLETYRPMTHPTDVPFEGVADPIPPEELTRVPITVMGGYKDHFVIPETCIDWHHYVTDGPESAAEVEQIFKPNTVAPSATNLTGADAATLPKFRLFMDKEGGHFAIFDKEFGGADWTFGIVSQTCLGIPMIAQA